MALVDQKKFLYQAWCDCLEINTRKISLDNKKVSKARNQAARMVVITGSVFFICQLPYRVYSTAQTLEILVLSPEIALKLGMAGHGTQVNSALNATLYPALNRF